jgi:hypothetical protein
MKTKVQILATERREATYEGGRKSISFSCQTVVHGEKLEVGLLRVPHALAEPLLNKDGQLPPGFYELEYGLVVSFQDRTVGGRLVGITPAPDTSRSPVSHQSSGTPNQPVKAAA